MGFSLFSDTPISNHIKSNLTKARGSYWWLSWLQFDVQWCPPVPTSAHHAEICRLNGQSTNGSKRFPIPFAAEVAACGDTERLNQAQFSHLQAMDYVWLCGLCGLLVICYNYIVVGNCWPVRSSVLPAYLWVGSHLWLRIRSCRTRQSEGIWNVILDSY